MLLFGWPDEESENCPLRGQCRKRAVFPFYPIKVLLVSDWEGPSIISLGLNKPSASTSSHLSPSCRPHPSLSPLQSGCHDSSWSLTSPGVLCVKVKTHQTQKLYSSLKLQERGMSYNQCWPNLTHRFDKRWKISLGKDASVSLLTPPPNSTLKG